MAFDIERMSVRFLENLTLYFPSIEPVFLSMDASGINMKGVSILSGQRITKNFGEKRSVTMLKETNTNSKS